MSFQDVLDSQFPGSRPEPEFVASTAGLLAPHGFTTENTLACVSCCRDEISTPLKREVAEVWGNPFSFSALAGLYLAGRTGMGAALAHMPQEDGRERVVIFAMPHVAIGENGEPGRVMREGQVGPSGACGALLAAKHDIDHGTAQPGLDFADPEQSLLRTRLLSSLTEKQRRSDLFGLTKALGQLVRADLEAAIGSALDTSVSDYALFAGVQIHGPEHHNYTWISDSFAVVSGMRKELRV